MILKLCVLSSSHSSRRSRTVAPSECLLCWISRVIWDRDTQFRLHLASCIENRKLSLETDNTSCVKHKQDAEPKVFRWHNQALTHGGQRQRCEEGWRAAIEIIKVWSFAWAGLQYSKSAAGLAWTLHLHMDKLGPQYNGHRDRDKSARSAGGLSLPWDVDID